MVKHLKVGDKVCWDWTVGGTKRRGTICGKIIEKNPSICPSVKFRVKMGKETFCPSVRLYKKKIKSGRYPYKFRTKK